MLTRITSACLLTAGKCNNWGGSFLRPHPSMRDDARVVNKVLKPRNCWFVTLYCPCSSRGMPWLSLCNVVGMVNPPTTSIPMNRLIPPLHGNDQIRWMIQNWTRSTQNHQNYDTLYALTPTETRGISSFLTYLGYIKCDISVISNQKRMKELPQWHDL